MPLPLLPASFLASYYATSPIVQRDLAAERHYLAQRHARDLGRARHFDTKLMFGAGPGWKGVEAQLRQGNWSFTRVSGGHRVYSRWAGPLAESGASAAPQLATLASWGWSCWLPGCATRPRGAPYPAGRVRCFL